MRKLILLIAIATISFSCSSDDSGPALSDTPDAKAQYDDSSFGIYKGVFVGSTGTVVVNVFNDGAAEATVTINGSSKTYTSAEKVAEDFAIEGMTFTNGSNSFDFSVDGDGDSPYISSISISGHANARMAVVKEFSNSLVKCYQGTYSGDDSGTFNLIIEGNSIDGLAKSNSDDFGFNLFGSVSGTTLGGIFEGGTFTGTSSGNHISGSWANDFEESGSWSGNRKL